MRRLIFITILIVLHWSIAFAQEYPDKIDGYKVYEAKVSFITGNDLSHASENEVVVSLAEPEIDDFGLSGVSLTVDGKVSGTDQKGRIERVTFSDIRINGIGAEAMEFRGRIDLRPGETIELPEPIRLRIGIGGIARAAFREFVQERAKWRVTGTVFVFGKFKKFGIRFKRVVPIKFDLEIPNPVRRYLDRGR